MLGHTITFPRPCQANRMHPTPRLFVVAALVVNALLAPTSVLAQQFPIRPIRLVVAFPAGGATDVLARLLARSAEPHVGQPLIVENRPGANAMVGAGAVLSAEPDGYTLYVGAISGLSKAVLPISTIDPLRDFAPVANAVRGGYFMYVRASLPARTLDDLIAYSKANPGKTNYASSSPLTDMIFQVLRAKRGLDASSISYKGAAPALQSLLAGDCDFSIDSIPVYLPQVEAGKVRILFGTLPFSKLPDVPTADKVGLTNFGATWNVGVFAPARAPASVPVALNPPFRAAVAEPDFAEQARKLGGEPSAPTPEEFRRQVEAEIGFWVEASRLAK
jgi:tripartite-type tricarboxylate transporter receptor subunit TctC